MYAVVQIKRNRFTKTLAMGLAVLALVFFLQITAHGHNDSRQDSACRVCQLAHVGVAPAVAVVTLTTPLVAIGRVTAQVSKSEIRDFSSQSSPRAPPPS